MRQRQWNWEILDSRYYFSYGAPFVPWLQFVNFARRLPLPLPLPAPAAAAAQADVVSIAESISILLPNNVFFLSSSIDCVMLFIEPVRERKGCLRARVCRVQPCRIRYELHVKMFYWLTIFYAI